MIIWPSLIVISIMQMSMLEIKRQIKCAYINFYVNLISDFKFFDKIW